ncbi:MAG: hypothetical protein GC204_14765 [Chloroflexi bacterium]|nr:hypothetical protein [Chloroflexota bacterium]
MKKIAILCCLVVLMGVVAVVSAQDVTEAAAPGCSLPFEAEVIQGPDAKLALSGTLSLSLDDTGAATGSLMTDDKTEYPVVGQIVGRSINLAFDLGDEVYIFGVGTSFEPVLAGNCGKALGGPFVGPAPDDTGTWLAGSAIKPAKGS